MLLTLIRTKIKNSDTMGVLLVDGKMMCHTMEPPLIPNDLHPKGAIAMGYYKVTLSQSPHFKRVLPLLHMVPGFEGVRMHAGNRPEDTRGCVLVGQYKEYEKGQLWLSDARSTEEKLVEYMLNHTEKNEEIYLDITNRERFRVERMQTLEQYLRDQRTATAYAVESGQRAGA